MRKLFRRREFLHLRTRDAIECFGLAWATRSWLDPTWGGVGTWLWWANLVLTGAVSVSLLVVVFTKAKAGPKVPPPDLRHLATCPARYFVGMSDCKGCAPAPPLTGMPIVESPFVPKGKFFAVNPETLSEMIRKVDVTQFRFTEKMPEEPKPFLREDAAAVAERLSSLSTARCPHEWDEPISNAGCRAGEAFSKHRCNRTVGLHGRECTCRCGATAAYPFTSTCTHSIGCPAHLGVPCPPSRRAEQERLDLLKPPHERPVRDVEGPE